MDDINMNNKELTDFVGRVVDEVFEALDNESGFLHYPHTNEEWNKLRQKIRRRLMVQRERI